MASGKYGNSRAIDVSDWGRPIARFFASRLKDLVHWISDTRNSNSTPYLYQNQVIDYLPFSSYAVYNNLMYYCVRAQGG